MDNSCEILTKKMGFAFNRDLFKFRPVADISAVRNEITFANEEVKTLAAIEGILKKEGCWAKSGEEYRTQITTFCDWILKKINEGEFKTLIPTGKKKVCLTCGHDLR